MASLPEVTVLTLKEKVSMASFGAARGGLGLAASSAASWAPASSKAFCFAAYPV